MHLVDYSPMTASVKSTSFSQSIFFNFVTKNIDIFFLISAQEHMLYVLIRSTLAGRF